MIGWLGRGLLVYGLAQLLARIVPGFALEARYPELVWRRPLPPSGPAGRKAARDPYRRRAPATGKIARRR